MIPALLGGRVMQIPVRFGVLAASAAGMLGCATEAAPPSSSTAAAPQTCKLHADCASGWCKDGVCGPKASCTDGVQNATETGVDCGGPCAACPPPPPRCDDAIQNGKETDLDCGGTCGPCAVGKSCSGNADCASALCVSTVCRAPGWALGAGVDGFGGYTVVATLKMATPSALAFNPAAPDELWVANRKDGSLTIVSLTNGTAVRYVDKALHFLEGSCSCACPCPPPQRRSRALGASRRRLRTLGAKGLRGTGELAACVAGRRGWR